MIIDFLVRVQEAEPDWSGDQKILLMGNYATKDGQVVNERELRLYLPIEAAEKLALHPGSLLRIYVSDEEPDNDLGLDF